MIVAELAALLGLKLDQSAWKRGQEAINKVQSGLARVAKWGAVAIGALGAGSVVLGDSYTELENRIRQVSSSTDEMNELMDRTRAIANDTRSDWKSTGEAYVRLKNATKDMGLTHNRALGIVETLNMALQSSGASASEAAAGTLQLMQGLASGALQGDEFRSIAEQLPDLMDLFAKEMKVSRGELKKLGADGKITSKVVIGALENASDSIRKKFAASTATAAQGWTVLKNNLTLAAGEFIRSTGLMDALGRGMQALTEWVESHREEISEFGAVVGAAFSLAFDVLSSVVGFLLENREVVEALLVVMIALGVAMAAAWIAAQLPIIAVIAALTAVAYGVIKLVRHWDQVKEAGGRAWDFVKRKARSFWEFIKSIPGRIVDSFRAMGRAIVGAVVEAFETLVRKAGEAAEAIGNKIKGAWGIRHVIRAGKWASEKASNVVDAAQMAVHAGGQLAAAGAPGGNTYSATTTNQYAITQLPGESGEQLARRIAEHDQQSRRAAFDALRGDM